MSPIVKTPQPRTPRMRSVSTYRLSPGTSIHNRFGKYLEFLTKSTTPRRIPAELKCASQRPRDFGRQLSHHHVLFVPSYNPWAGTDGLSNGNADCIPA